MPLRVGSCAESTVTVCCDVLRQCDDLPMGADGACQPAMRWVASGQLEGEGLSSSVVKVAKLAAAQDAGAKKGIKRFYAVTNAADDDGD